MLVHHAIAAPKKLFAACSYIGEVIRQWRLLVSDKFLADFVDVLLNEFEKLSDANIPITSRYMRSHFILKTL